MTKIQILTNKAVYLGLSILDLSNTEIYEFWYDYVKPKYGGKSNLCYMDSDSFIVYVKIDDIYEDITEDVESNYELEMPPPKVRNKKITGLMKDKLCGKIITEVSGLRAKTL